MLDSFCATRSEGTDIQIYVDREDPRIGEYWALAFKASDCVAFRFGPRLTLPEVFNWACGFGFGGEPDPMAPTARDYYVDCNDDFIFHTPAWDQKLAAAIEANGPCRTGLPVGCAYGRTMNLPSGAMFSRRSIEAVGWWFPPGFKHQYVDNVQRDLYAAAGQLYYVDDVRVEHRHPLLMQGESRNRPAWDETYAYVYSEELRAHDARAYLEWRSNRACDDVANLMAAKR